VLNFFAPGQIEHGAQSKARRLLIDHNRKLTDQGDELARARRGDTPVALAYRKRVGYFQVPQLGDFGGLVLEPVQQRAGCLCRLVVKAPGKAADESITKPLIADLR
jgi:hypothetical protein